MAALFGLLLTSPHCRATSDEIEHCLWPGERVPPNRVSRCVTDLRQALRGRVERMHSSVCSIILPVESVDYLRFRDGVRQAAALGPQERFEKLSVALDEWSDEEPLQGLSGVGFEVRKSELRIERRKAVIDRLDAAHCAGDYEWLLKEAEELLERRPRDEQIFRFHLTAQASHVSLTALRNLVAQWIRKFGPPTDQQLRKCIDDIRSRSSGRRGLPIQPDHMIPRQLPSTDRALFGRGDQLAELRSIIMRQRAELRGALVVLTGMAGVGKSALANHLAEQVATDFPDGTLYANLQGFSGGMEPAGAEQILDRFLADLGVRSRATSLEGKSAALRSVLATRSLLMVLDDAASADQVLPLLPGAGACAVIVTSRSGLADLLARKELCATQVGPLDSEASASVLNEALNPVKRRRIGHHIAELVELCGRLPLALVVIAKYIRDRPPEGIGALVAQLREEQQRLHALDLSDHALSVRLALDCSVRALSSPAKVLLWQIAVHPGPSISWSAAMDLGRVGVGVDADRAVDELVGANLVQLVSERYRLHDLVRAYARHDVHPDSDGPIQCLEEETVRQVLEHQLQNVRACDRVIDPQRRLPVEGAVDVAVVEPCREEEAMAYLDTEYEAVMGGIELAIRKGQDRYVWLLPMALVTYQWRRNRHSAAERNLQPAEEASRKIASSSDRAIIYRMLAGSQIRRGAFDTAARHLQQAVRLSEREETDAGRLSLARSLHLHAIALRRQENLVAADEGFRRALAMFRTLGDDVGQAAALNGIGTLHHDRGEYDDALHRCSEALRIFETTTDLNGKANVLVTLAKIHLSRSERSEALALYPYAIGIYRELGYWPNEATTLRCYADVLLTAGRAHEAVKALERVVVLLESMGGEGVREVLDLLDNLR